MFQARKYLAASVPRFLRQTKLGYLPLNSVIGSRFSKGDGGVNLFFDIIMLPVHEFQRMRNNIGLQHVIAPALKVGPTFSPGFILADVKEVVVPASEPDPENYAKNYFLMVFDLIAPATPVELTDEKDMQRHAFSQAAKECAKANK